LLKDDYKNFIKDKKSHYLFGFFLMLDGDNFKEKEKIVLD
jgi:hypothetical protein